MSNMKISQNKLVSMTYSIYEKDCLVENVESPVSFIFGKETNLLPIVENSFVDIHWFKFKL